MCFSRAPAVDEQEGSKEHSTLSASESEKPKKKRKCPACGSESIAEIMYGMPVNTPELQEALSEGKLSLGGCWVSDASPRWEWQRVVSPIQNLRSNIVGTRVHCFQGGGTCPPPRASRTLPPLLPSISRTESRRIVRTAPALYVPAPGASLARVRIHHMSSSVTLSCFCARVAVPDPCLLSVRTPRHPLVQAITRWRTCPVSYSD